jgi:hypothetical protein
LKNTGILLRNNLKGLDPKFDPKMSVHSYLMPRVRSGLVENELGANWPGLEYTQSAPLPYLYCNS